MITEQTVTGTAWPRTKKITIHNELEELPTIVWGIERAVDIGGEIVKKDLGEISVPFDPSKQIPVRNPTTGELTGATVSMGEIYALIFSAFFVYGQESGVVNVG